MGGRACGTGCGAGVFVGFGDPPRRQERATPQAGVDGAVGVRGELPTASNATGSRGAVTAVSIPRTPIIFCVFLGELFAAEFLI